jgi:hypothetical protein
VPFRSLRTPNINNISSQNHHKELRKFAKRHLRMCLNVPIDKLRFWFTPLRRAVMRSYGSRRPKVFVGFIGATFGLALLVPIALPQESQDKPLGDIVRAQQNARKQQTKTAPKKIYNNRDVASATESSSGQVPSASTDKPADAKTSASPPSTAKQTAQANAQKPLSIFDQPKDGASDAVIIPAGTIIRVEISTTPDNKLEGQVSWPVRVGFATPIPALSKVTVRIVSQGTVWDSFDGSVSSAYYVELTTLTIGDTTYKVQADAAPLTYPETVFTLSAPLNISN